MFCEIFTGRSKGEWREFAAEVRFLNSRVAELSTALSTGSGAALSARVAELEAALETMQANHRRELGRLWKIVGREPEKSNGVTTVRDSDPDIQALLALQSAPPAQPGGR